MKMTCVQLWLTENEANEKARTGELSRRVDQLTTKGLTMQAMKISSRVTRLRGQLLRAWRTPMMMTQGATWIESGGIWKAKKQAELQGTTLEEEQKTQRRRWWWMWERGCSMAVVAKRIRLKTCPKGSAAARKRELMLQTASRREEARSAHGYQQACGLQQCT